ncbi:hypothetical protein Syun_011435 [Stephania yunnanensis]|uniref:Transmembrane protein 14 n=1 Tax=Stephania yunnanensis TaxID=152371 RepID=A0AAP0JZS0_9MAGN
MASTALTRISLSSSTNQNLKNNLHLHKPIIVAPRYRSKFSVCMHLDRSGAEFRAIHGRNTLSCAADASKSNMMETDELHPSTDEQFDGNLEVDVNLNKQDASATPPKRSAKIHDFCFGIPFGGFVFAGGILGFLFSRNATTLSTGVLYGGGLLALSTFSLKIWRQGKSSLPFILGQAALVAALLWKNLQNYYLTKKLFPTGLYAFFSATMLCFYSYVMASGGNPPPKKLKLESSSP